jgi:hypothetical protein
MNSLSQNSKPTKESWQTFLMLINSDSSSSHRSTRVQVVLPSWHQMEAEPFPSHRSMSVGGVNYFHTNG